jgi:hypothetical protein
MKRLFLSSLIFITCNICLYAKARIIDVEKELASAKTIAFVQIDAFTDSSISFSLGGVFLTVKSFSAKLKNFDKSLIGISKTGGIPKIKAPVLIVIDSSNYVSLFANYTDQSDLVFWSPIDTGSECLFYYAGKFNFLNEKDVFENAESKSCWRNVKITLDDFYTFYAFDTYEFGYLQNRKDEILFIPEIAYGRSYSISNKQLFKKLVGKKIMAFGRLTKYHSFEVKEFEIVEE